MSSSIIINYITILIWDIFVPNSNPFPAPLPLALSWL